MSRASAWFHLDTMRQAYVEMEALVEEKRQEAEDRWKSTDEKGWVWDSWFSIPRYRSLTWEEYCWKHSFGWNKYYWKQSGAGSDFLYYAKHYIELAQNSEGNIVLLDEYSARRDFNGFLTKSVKPDNQLFLVEG